MFDIHAFKANILYFINMVQLDKYSVGGIAQVQTKINFFLDDGKHIWVR